MGKITSFDTLEKALEYLRKLNVPITSVEDAALKAGAEQAPGLNILKMVSPIKGQVDDLKKVGGMGPPPPIDVMPPFEGLPPPGEIPKNIPVIGGSVAFGRWIAPRKSTFLRLESQTGIRVHTDLYEPMEEALLKKRVFVHPWNESAEKLVKGVSKAQRQGYALAMQTLEGSSGESKLVEEFKLDQAKLGAIRNWFDDLFSELGAGDARPYFSQMVPQIQMMGKVRKAFPDKNLRPQQVSFFRRFIDMGHIPLWKTELDIRQLMLSHLHNGAFQRFAGQVWENSRKMWDQNLKDPNVPASVAGLVKNYLDDIMGHTTPRDAMMLQALGKGILQLQGKMGEGVSKEQAMSASRKLFGWLWALNYSANLGLRPAAVGRQFLQTPQTTVNVFGFRAVFGGGGGIDRLATEEGVDLIQKAGILVEEAPFHGEEGVKPIFGKIFRRSDNIQRAVAGLSQDSLLLRWLPTYTKAGDWAKFVDKSQLDWYHPIIQQQVKQLIDSGQVLKARLRLMREAAESTQWIYRGGNQPELFRGIGGRMFGQYGIWPTYYADFLTNMMTRGPWKKRVARASRWVAVNSALAAGMSAVLGADAASWLWFQPVGFSGGPYFQISSDIYTTVAGRGPEANLARFRLKRAPAQVIPGAQAARDLFDIYKELDQGDTQGAIRELLGYPAEK